jgi:hypothetical protein
LSSPITLNEDRLEDARQAEEKVDPNVEDVQVTVEDEDIKGDGSDE